MRVLLIQPRYTYPRDVPLIVEMPLGLCYLAAVLRQRGHEVQILDCLAEGYTRTQAADGGRVTYGISDEEITQRIKGFRPQVVGCSAMLTLQYGNVEKLCRLVKTIDREIVVVVGGMHPTVKPEEVLANPDIDFLLRGEADYTLAELVDALEHHGEYAGIDGIGYRSPQGMQIRDKRHFIDDLDSLPLPARDLLKVDNYFQAGLAHGFVLRNKRNVNLITSRGCPARCVFCTVHLMWGRRFRARSPENVLAELEHLKRVYQVKHVQFEDDNLTYDIERAKTIFRGMIDRKLNLAWTTPNGVALWRMDEETLRLMKQAGCYCTKFAVESGNQRVLSEVIQKPQRLETIIPLIHYARKIGIKVGSFFVVGLPGETREEMQDSFRFPHRVKLDWAEYSIATPHHGTALRSICEKEGYLRPHSDADLYARKGLIETPEFSPDWLEQAILAENRRYLWFLMLHQPMTLLSQGWEVFKRNPAFTLWYLWKTMRACLPWHRTKMPSDPTAGRPPRPKFLQNHPSREEEVQA